MKHLEDILTRHTPSIIEMDLAMQSAVCIPLIKTAEGWNVLFEVRSSKIAHQPGDICFPGGMIEEGETPDEAAIRETYEELLIEKDQIEMISPIDFLHTDRLVIYPFAAKLYGYDGTYAEGEVAKTFQVPLSFFLETEPECYIIEAKVEMSEDFPYDRIVGGKNYRWRRRKERIYFYQFGDYAIWGLTAKIIKTFAKIVHEGSVENESRKPRNESKNINY